jgi:hypothetical protein
MESKMNFPTLSVVVPNYNHANYLRENLESLLQQSVQPLEIIVIDDCSTDNSMAVLEEVSQKHPLVTFCRNEKNLGVNSTLNRGLELARGEYVYFFGADDRTLPGFFEKALSLLARHPEAGLCFPNPASFDHVTGRIKENQLSLSGGPAYFAPDELVALGQHKRVLLHGMSLIKRSAAREAGGFLSELKWHGDFFLVFVIGFRHGACYLPEKLTLWRSLPESYMTAGLRRWRLQQEVVQHVLELLHSTAYGDVLLRFQKSGVMAFAPRASLAILGRRKYWGFLNWTMLKRAVPMDIFWSLPHWLQRILRRWLAK